MKIPISTYRKPPRRPKTVRRTRLVDLIHQNIQRKLTFLCAPAGYGKTTLLIDFAEDADAHVAWCRAVPEDEGLAYFFQHLIYSLRESWPGFGHSLEEISFQEITLQPRALAIELANAVSSSIDDFTLLILDDFHIISGNLTIVAFIEYFLELLPDQLRLVIGSRSFYGIPTASLYVDEELAIINADDLRFRVNEVKDLARRQFHILLNDQQAEDITLQSEGWVMSILLVMRGWNSTSSLPPVAEAREHIYEYLDKEIYARLPLETQRFLRCTALCEQFDPALANHVLQIDHSKSIVKELEESNLFIYPSRDGKGISYQYHPLFREFLVSQFNEESTAEKAGVLLHIASWYEAQEDPILAVHHYLLGGEVEHAAAIMDAQARSMYISGREDVLNGWFQALSGPPDRRSLAPDLVLNWVKVKTNQGKMEGCLEQLDIAEPIFSAQGRYENLANLLIVRGMILRFQNEFGQAMEIARRALALVETHRLDPYYVCQADRLEGLGLFHTGQPKQAFIKIEAALQGFRGLERKHSSDRLKHDLIMTLLDLGMMSLLTGDTFHAQGSFEEAMSISLTLRGNRGDLATCANDRAYLSFLTGDFRQAWKFYEQALAAAEQVDWTRSIVQVLNGQAELLILVGEFERARAILDRAVKVAQSVPEGRVSPATYQEMADVEKWTGQYNQALYHLREAALVSGMVPSTPAFQIRMASIYVCMEEWDVAQAALLAAVDALKNEPPSSVRSMGWYYLAETFFHLGDKEEALAYLKKALNDLTRLGHDTFLVDLVHRSPAMVQALASQWGNNHARAILDRALEFPQGYEQLLSPEARPLETAGYRLQVKALGGSEIRRDTELIPLANWQSAGARALFFYILDHGRVKREEIALVFWPDFSNAKVNSNFHATLWRVRNAIGKKNIIAFDGQYYSIHGDADVFYDAQEFETLVSRLEESHLPESERSSMFAQAVDLYAGDFLADIDMPWSDDRRRELKEKYLRLLQQYAAEELAHNHPSTARRLYEKAIQADPYEDQFHLGLMKCLVEMKMAYSARSHFEEYCRILDEELGSDPMPELKAFAEGI